MGVSREEVQDLIAAGDLSALFLQKLHWDNPSRQQFGLYGSDGLRIPGTGLTAHPVASKRVVDLWRVPCETIPSRTPIRKTVATLRKQHSLELLIAFEAADDQMLWLWPEQRRTGNGFQLVEHSCNRNSIDPAMLDRLCHLRFDPEEEEHLTSIVVLEKVRLSLDVDLAGLERDVERTIASAVGHLGDDLGVSERIGKILCQESGDQSEMMAAAILFNAVVFQHHIADRHAEIPTPEKLRSSGLKRADVEAAWTAVIGIDYWPIFGIARDLLASISDDESANKVLRELYGRAAETTAHRDTQGIIGELYGRLVADRAFLKTHFTRVGSAAFLAEMAVDRLTLDWADPEEITRLRVADLACGTGALLTAAYRRIAARHEEAGGYPAHIHTQMMEEVLIGCDIMPASVHLTAAMLSSEYPDRDYRNTKTWIMPYGYTDLPRGAEFRLGSLHLLGTDYAGLRVNLTGSLFGEGTERMTSTEATSDLYAEVPERSMDLVIMNPPFARPTNQEPKSIGLGRDIARVVVPNPAFAGMGNDQEAQRKMSAELGSLYNNLKERDCIRAGNGYAGLASNFIDLAHGKLRPGGVLALIVPVTVVSGPSWAGTRGLLAQWYEDIWVATLTSTTDSETRSFSDDTGMAEAIIVATKRSTPADPTNGAARYICLRNRPETTTEGVDRAREVKTGGELDRPGGSHSGFAVSTDFTETVSGHPTGVVTPELASIAALLQRGVLRLPGWSDLGDLPMTRLGQLGRRAPVHREISTRGGAAFEINVLDNRSQALKVGYPVLWRHDYSQERKLRVLPCSEGIVRPGMEHRARKLWNGYINAKGEGIAGATRLHLNNDFRLSSQATGACLTPMPTIGGVAWPSFQPKPPRHAGEEKWEKALCIWLNSVLGLVARWWVSSRQQSGRARLSVTTLKNIPVLDIRRITPVRLEAAATLFDEFEDREFLPANEAYRDQARADLDKALAKRVLHLPDEAVEGIARLRHMWCSEPSVHGNKRTRPGGPAGS